MQHLLIHRQVYVVYLLKIVLSHLSLTSLVLASCQTALQFWEYQSEAEIQYFQMSNKELKNRIHSQENQQKENLLEATSQINLLNNRLHGVSEQLESKKREIMELEDKCRQRTMEKNRLQEMYNDLKKYSEPKETSNKPIPMQFAVPKPLEKENMLNSMIEKKRSPISSMISNTIVKLPELKTNTSTSSDKWSKSQGSYYLSIKKPATPTKIFRTFK
jgi:chromosome segregation ATPase